MPDYIKELVSVPGAAIVAGVLMSLAIMRHGLLAFFRDRRELRVDDAYSGIIEALRAEVARLRSAVDDLQKEIHKLRLENEELRRKLS